MKSCERAFSLIELLVVVGIIAIVAAILFPVLARAKASGRSAACVSNLHQLSAAILIYSDASEGPPPNNSQGSWEEKIGMSASNSAIGAGPRGQAPILSCPTYAHVSTDDYTSGYAMNGCYVSSKQVADPSDSVLVAEVAAYQYLPGRGPMTRMFLDAPDSFFSRREFFEERQATEVRPIGEWGSLRHFGKGHYAMVDGHIATLAPSRFRVPAHDKWCRLNATEWEGPIGGPHFALLEYGKR